MPGVLMSTPCPVARHRVPAFQQQGPKAHARACSLQAYATRGKNILRQIDRSLSACGCGVRHVLTGTPFRMRLYQIVEGAGCTQMVMCVVPKSCGPDYLTIDRLCLEDCGIDSAGCFTCQHSRPLGFGFDSAQPLCSSEYGVAEQVTSRTLYHAAFHSGPDRPMERTVAWPGLA
jgi:hypothetical protein